MNKKDPNAVKKHNESRGLELGRFLVTGIVCALLDFLVMSLVMNLLLNAGCPNVWADVISVTCGFIIGVILNYILSTFWVFKNVKDKKQAKKAWFIIVFVLLSACALGLSIGTWELCRLVCNSAWGIEISDNQILDKIIHFTFWTDAAFWAYFVSFCLKTIVGLVWNYFTRKYILYREPKKDN